MTRAEIRSTLQRAFEALRPEELRTLKRRCASKGRRIYCGGMAGEWGDGREG